jgi:ureidoglycolate lyase
MTGLVVRPVAPDAKVFTPFGRFVTPPDLAGERTFYSEALHDRDPQSAPVLHVNHVPETKLPVQIT